MGETGAGTDASNGEAEADASPDGPEEEHSPDASAETSADAAADAATDATDGGEVAVPVVCATSTPFGTPVPFPGAAVATYHSSCSRLSADERWLVISLDQGDQADIFTATRDSRADPFRSLTLLAALNGPSNDGCVTMTADRLTAYYQSARSGQFALWMSTRPSEADPFSTPVPLDALNNNSEGGPYLAAGDRALYFYSYRDGDANLYRVDRSGAGFGPITPVSVNTTQYSEISPVVSDDELTIYFARDGNPANSGRWEIFMATRASVNDSFGVPAAVEELNMEGADQAPSWLSPDRCRLYFHRAPDYNWNTFVAERTP